MRHAYPQNLKATLTRAPQPAKSAEIVEKRDIRGVGMAPGQDQGRARRGFGRRDRARLDGLPGRELLRRACVPARGGQGWMR
jgi:hypothetical protein